MLSRNRYSVEEPTKTVYWKALKRRNFEMSVFNSLNGEQVQEYVDKGFYQSNVEDNLGSRVDHFFQRSSGTQIIVDDGDIRKYDGESGSVSINIDDNYAYLLESDTAIVMMGMMNQKTVSLMLQLATFENI
jgi:hypothetical protein